MGKVVASYLVKVTLHERDDLETVEGTVIPEPTNADIERLIGDALYNGLDYYTDAAIGVTSERTDR